MGTEQRMTLPSTELIEWWRPKLRAVDPRRMVQLEEIHDLYVERGDAPYRSVVRDLLLAERPAEVKVLLCGARGSGKTTELTGSRMKSSRTSASCAPALP